MGFLHSSKYRCMLLSVTGLFLPPDCGRSGRTSTAAASWLTWISTPAALWTKRSGTHSWHSTTSSWVSTNSLSLSSLPPPPLPFLSVRNIDFLSALCLSKWWERRRRRATPWTCAPATTRFTESARWRSVSSVWSSSRTAEAEMPRRSSEGPRRSSEGPRSNQHVLALAWGKRQLLPCLYFIGYLLFLFQSIWSSLCRKTKLMVSVLICSSDYFCQGIICDLQFW